MTTSVNVTHMKHHVNLCFTQEGLIRTKDLDFLQDNTIETLVFFGDGSLEAIAQMREFIKHPSFQENQTKTVKLVHTPLYEMRAVNRDGSLSKPHYALDVETRDKWLCSYVAAPNFDMSLGDITSPSETQVRLNEEQTQTMCYAAFRLWNLLLIAEQKLVFPAAVIDRMTRWTYHLTPKTIDIDLLRQETGLDTLDYNPDTDLLTLEIANEVFFVKLSVLNDVYGKLILPFFNKLYGRRLRLNVSVGGQNGSQTEKIPMTYGDLGRLIESMRSYVKEKRIGPSSPIPPADLILFSDRVDLNDKSCLDATDYESIDAAITDYQVRLLARYATNDDDDFIHTPDLSDETPRVVGQ